MSAAVSLLVSEGDRLRSCRVLVAVPHCTLAGSRLCFIRKSFPGTKIAVLLPDSDAEMGLVRAVKPFSSGHLARIC